MKFFLLVKYLYMNVKSPTGTPEPTLRSILATICMPMMMKRTMDEISENSTPRSSDHDGLTPAQNHARQSQPCRPGSARVRVSRSQSQLARLGARYLRDSESELGPCTVNDG